MFRCHGMLRQAGVGPYCSRRERAIPCLVGQYRPTPWRAAYRSRTSGVVEVPTYAQIKQAVEHRTDGTEWVSEQGRNVDDDETLSRGSPDRVAVIRVPQRHTHRGRDAVTGGEPIGCGDRIPNDEKGHERVIEDLSPPRECQ